MKKEKIHDTKTVILDAAERLFATQGFQATSLRDITGEADANLGAVNYHFTSKDALILAVLKRRIRPLNEARLALLTKFETAAGGRPLTVEKILEALFRPVMGLLSRPASEGGLFLNLIVKILAEPGDYLKPLVEEEFVENKRRFHEALRKAMPGLTEEDAYWKLHFSMGMFIHTVSHAELLKHLSEGRCCVEDTEAAMKRMIAFCAAGFAAGGIK